jgi:prephenate dehydrogenase
MSLPRKTVPTIGLLGFGAFGRLVAGRLCAHFPLVVHDRAAERACGDFAACVFSDIRAVAACDIVILAVPVDQISSGIAALRPHLRAGSIVLDVGSVKVQPILTMQTELPAGVEIIGTHPLFGPQSARDGLKGLKIAICPIRGRAVYRIAAFLRRVLGLKVFFTTPEAHDREAALVQGLTHLIAKVLVAMEPLPTRLTTASFDLLVRATEMVRYDPRNVFEAIERANPHSAAARARFLALAAQIDLALEADHRASPSRALSPRSENSTDRAGDCGVCSEPEASLIAGAAMGSR